MRKHKPDCFFIIYVTMRDNNMEYLERLRGLREDRMLKQQEIADLIFVSQRTYSDYETGRIRIPVENLIRLARYYDVSVDYISGASNVKRHFPEK